MSNEEWVFWVAGAGAVGWWLLRGDVGDWRRVMPPEHAEVIGMLLLSLAVGVLIWMMAALEVDVPDFLEGVVFMIALCSALTAAAVVLFGLRLLIVTIVQRFRD